MSSGSYSGLAMHDAVHRYWKELMIAPNLTSSWKAEYVMMSVIGQLRGLPKISVVAWNVCSSAMRSGGGIAVVGQFEFSTLWVEGFIPRMVPG